MSDPPRRAQGESQHDTESKQVGKKSKWEQVRRLQGKDFLKKAQVLESLMCLSLQRGGIGSWLKRLDSNNNNKDN